MRYSCIFIRAANAPNEVEPPFSRPLHGFISRKCKRLLCFLPDLSFIYVHFHCTQGRGLKGGLGTEAGRTVSGLINSGACVQNQLNTHIFPLLLFNIHDFLCRLIYAT